MKRLFTLLIICLGFTYSQAQTTVSSGAGYTDQAWYSLSTGSVTTATSASWDLAFSTGNFTSTIRVNGGAKLKVYAVPNKTADDYDGTIDTTGLSASWTPLYNADTTWDVGALNNEGAEFYSYCYPCTDGKNADHSLVAARVYVLVYDDGSAKKFVVTQSYNYNNTSGYTVMVSSSNLDNSNHTTKSFLKGDYADKNFVYYSIANDEILDLEPATADWDLLFGHYITSNYKGSPNQRVGGVLVNNGVSVQKVTGVDPATYVAYDLSLFTDTVSQIGWDWKDINYQTFAWELADDYVYFVKTADDNIYKIYFTAFGGSSTGNYEFEQELVYDAAKVAGISDFHNNALNIYPNVLSTGSTLNLDIDANYEPTTTQIINLTGQVVSSAAFNNELQINDLAQGTYLVTVNTNAGLVSQRIVIR